MSHVVAVCLLPVLKTDTPPCHFVIFDLVHNNRPDFLYNNYRLLKAK